MCSVLILVSVLGGVLLTLTLILLILTLLILVSMVELTVLTLLGSMVSVTSGWLGSSLSQIFCEIFETMGPFSSQ